jgi:hypothetical protein
MVIKKFSSEFGFILNEFLNFAEFAKNVALSAGRALIIFYLIMFLFSNVKHTVAFSSLP